MAEYTIKDLEKLSGILAHTIRIWEKRYGIFNPGRTDTNRRRYSDDDLRRIINIAILNRNGFKISKIAGLKTNEIEEKVSFFARNVSQADTQIDALVMAMSSLDEEKFVEVLNRSLITKGFEDTFDYLVFPFLRKVGVLWTTGTVFPAQEHFVSNLIRQKLIAGIDSLSVVKGSSSRVLLFLHENELHELGLLYYKYLADKNAFKTLYLGQLTPLESVAYAIRTWRPAIVVTGTLSAFSNVDGYGFIDRLKKIAGKCTIILAGNLSGIELKGSGKGIIQVSGSKDFLAALNK